MDNLNEQNFLNTNNSGQQTQGYIPAGGYGTGNASPAANTGYYQNGAYAPYNYGYGCPPQMNPYEVSPAEKRALKNQQFGAFIEVFIHSILSGILAMIFVEIAFLFGYSFVYNDDNIVRMDSIYNLIASLPSVIVCIGIFIFEKCSRREKMRDYFPSEKVTFPFVIGMVGMVMLAYALAMFTSSAVTNLMFELGVSPVAEEYLTDTVYTWDSLAAEFFTSVIAAPIAEELLYRGVILRRFSNISQRFGIIMSSVFFGLMHGNLNQSILGFCLGLVLGYAVVKTGSLAVSILGHMTVNLFAVSYTFAEAFIGEEGADIYWTALMIGCLVIGLVTLVILLSKGRIRLPEYNEYHKKRTFPIMFRCVSFYLLAAYLIFEIISVMGPVTDKLLE